MNAKDAALLLLGAVLGAIFGAMFAPWYNGATAALARWRRRAASARREKDGVAGSLSVRLVEYYTDRGLASSLYVPKMVGPGKEIALLHDPSITFPPEIDIYRDDFLACDHTFTRFPVDKSVIRHYRRIGARLFDGEFMLAKAVTLHGDELTRLHVGRFNFFAYASICFKIQREIMSRWRRPVLHDTYLQTFRGSLGSDLQPQAVGCMAAVLVHGDDGIYLAIARRSTEVVNGPGMRSLAPVFGFECNAIGGRTSKYGLTFYNFVREFSEEFFDFEDLVDMMRSRHVDPDWIFQLPAAAAIRREAIEGRLVLRRTGVAINPNDGIVNIAVVAHFTSPSFFEQLLPEMRPNWETAGDMSAGPIEFVKIDDPRIDEWVAKQAIDPSSVFALDLARQYAAARAPAPRP